MLQYVLDVIITNDVPMLSTSLLSLDLFALIYFFRLNGDILNEHMVVFIFLLNWNIIVFHQTFTIFNYTFFLFIQNFSILLYMLVLITYICTLYFNLIIHLLTYISVKFYYNIICNTHFVKNHSTNLKIQKKVPVYYIVLSYYFNDTLCFTNIF